LSAGGLAALSASGGDAEALLAHGTLIFLGLIDERPHFALDFSHDEAPLESLRSPVLASSGIAEANLRFTDLRQLAGRLAHHEGALLAFARAMLFWHSRHRFCGLCGNPTRSEEAGYMRRCTDPVCNTMHFPRTDPAVIMLVTREDRALLGHSQRFPRANMYSTLAGFVEPGETLEEAVQREVFEESGIRAGAVHYHSSQPWPFPGNVMLGFYAEGLSEEITIDTEEMIDVRWFSRAEIRAPEQHGFALPRIDSIARRLIEDWMAAA
jgi:NAD+ diphosphatase